MKQYVYFLLTIALYSCSNTSDKNFIVEGEIVGLKKGTIYLEKIQDGEILVIDSVYIDNGKEEFIMANNIKEPEIFILSLDKLSTKQLLFFGEQGTTHIKTNLDHFYSKSKITGSSLHDLLETFDKYIKKFQDENLDLIKTKFESQKHNDFAEVEKIEQRRLQNLKRMYLFSANFAIAHKDKAIAPYIAYAKMEQAAPQLKQKIYDALEPEIKASKYGKLLNAQLIE
ncbi:DUF4369 domain-containing protein [Ochrovirga pacifica]|uniref:DUF4369 domain-containing protein n=1 Tax=Ochrovirga pacifica TaxID=1042376 RepID=UPI0002559D5A|nr:DUF4369 domain-containing protein [Ochrovirga pacifica]